MSTNHRDTRDKKNVDKKNIVNNVNSIIGSKYDFEDGKNKNANKYKNSEKHGFKKLTNSEYKELRIQKKEAKNRMIHSRLAGREDCPARGFSKDQDPVTTIHCDMDNKAEKSSFEVSDVHSSTLSLDSCDGLFSPEIYESLFKAFSDVLKEDDPIDDDNSIDIDDSEHDNSSDSGLPKRVNASKILASIPVSVELDENLEIEIFDCTFLININWLNNLRRYWFSWRKPLVPPIVESDILMMNNNSSYS